MVRPEETAMNPFDFVARLMTAATSYSLDEQWRIAVMSLAAFCALSTLALLPGLPELPPVTWLTRTFVPAIKVMRLLAGRRRDWRGALLDLLG
jgi:hypothetical protein